MPNSYDLPVRSCPACPRVTLRCAHLGVHALRLNDYRSQGYPDPNYYVVVLRWHGDGQPWPAQSMPGYELQASLEWRGDSSLCWGFEDIADAEESFSYWDERLREGLERVTARERHA